MEKRDEVKGRRNKHAANDGNNNLIIKLVFGIIIFIIVMVISCIIWYNTSLSGTGTSSEQSTFQIDLGSGTDKIANILKENDLLKSTLAFKLYVKLNNISNFQAGEYTISKDMGVPQIIDVLQSGKVLKSGNNITFIEGKTFSYIAKTIAENTSNTEQDVYDLLKDEEYINSIIERYWFITNEIKDENIYYALEGYLFPDTYSFDDENVKPQRIFDSMLDRMDEVLTSYKKDIEKSKYSVHQILSLASIIENEAIFVKDKKDISSVLYNRLNTNMSLGSDVTTYYAAKVELGSRDLYKSEINTYNPYNTRGPNMAGKIPVRTYFNGR